MFASDGHPDVSQILYSCYVARSREGEQFAADHVFSYQLAGTLVINDGIREWICREGQLRFVKRNSLLKFVKEPPPQGEFKALSIYLDQQTLRTLAREEGWTAPEGTGEFPSIVSLPRDPLYLGYMESLLSYLQSGKQGLENILSLKLREAVMLLLKVNPELRPLLFDFREPGKIDLESFMNRNYHFNVGIHRFAYLTGRSLSTFKRDFEKLFHTSPSRWLLHRRLQEAHFLIKEKGRAPSDIYLDLGFEDLSHFSYAFKKTYGVAPTRLGSG